MAQTPNFTPDIEAAAERIKIERTRACVEQREWPRLAGSLREDVERVLKFEEDTAKSSVPTGSNTCINASRPYSANVAGIPRCIQRPVELVQPPLAARFETVLDRSGNSLRVRGRARVGSTSWMQPAARRLRLGIGGAQLDDGQLRAARPSGSVRYRRHGLPERSPWHCPTGASRRKVRRQGELGPGSMATPSVAPFKYFDKGSMATIGRTHAVARSAGMSFTGIIAYLMWAFIHVLYLIGWGDRVRHPVVVGPLALVPEEPSAPHHNARSGDQQDRVLHASATSGATRSENGAREPVSTTTSSVRLIMLFKSCCSGAAERGRAVLRVARIGIGSRLCVPVTTACGTGWPAPS